MRSRVQPIYPPPSQPTTPSLQTSCPRPGQLRQPSPAPRITRQTSRAQKLIDGATIVLLACGPGRVQTVALEGLAAGVQVASAVRHRYDDSR